MKKSNSSSASSSKSRVRGTGVKSALPTREAILAFLRDAPDTAGKREIARAFNVTGAHRIALKRLLSEMTHDGALQGNRQHLSETGKLPPVGVYDVVGRDADGDLLAEPVEWDPKSGERPRVRVAPGRREAMGPGDRILAKALRDEDGAYLIALKTLPKEKSRALGIVRLHARGGGEIAPVDRKELRSWRLDPSALNSAKDGDLVRFDVLRGARSGLPEARVVEVLGNPEDQRQISLIAIHAHGIPEAFPDHVLAAAMTLEPFSLHGRTDLRQLPLITIDPADARDHDDAVHARADVDPKNSGGHVITVAIADVAAYVRPDTALDREALKRGNSVYFPDRVVPMLPERISNDLCSLKEDEDRPALAVEITIDRDGRKLRHRFSRIVMRSHAKLAYPEAQAAIDGAPTDKARGVLETALKPLWAAYGAMVIARNARGPLDLDLPERRVIVGPDGRVDKVIVPPRLDAHRLIEEMMIAANVAAAETLEKAVMGLIYRVHDAPSKEKLHNLREFLSTLDLAVPPQGQLKPEHFNRVLAKAKVLPVADLVNEVVLRSQAQAVYAARNLGHFGLNLARYAHFTSPIRRYADLIVHRALVRALQFGADGLSDGELQRLDDVAEAISLTERRAMAAERETTDRLIAAHLSTSIGATFEGRVSGVTKSGLFVKLRDTGADGFIPISTLGSDYFNHDAIMHALIGSRTREGYRLGDTVTVRLVEAVPTAGALRFQMLTEPQALPGEAAGVRGKRSERRFQADVRPGPKRR